MRILAITQWSPISSHMSIHPFNKKYTYFQVYVFENKLFPEKWCNDLDLFFLLTILITTHHLSDKLKKKIAQIFLGKIHDMMC